MRLGAAVLGIAIGFGMSAAGTGALAGAAEDLYGCDRTVGKPSRGSLTKSIDPAPGTLVDPGDTVRVTLTWDTEDWSENELHKVLDCVTIDDELAPELDGGESPTENDGRFTHEFVVPNDVPPGAQLCDQAMLSGPGASGDFGRQYSERLCLEVNQPGTGGGGEQTGAPAPPPHGHDSSPPHDHESPPPPGNDTVSSPARPPTNSPAAPPSGPSRDVAPSPPLSPSPGSPVTDSPPSDAVNLVEVGAPEQAALPQPLTASPSTTGAPLSSPEQPPRLANSGFDDTLVLVAGVAIAAGGALLTSPLSDRRRRPY